MLLILKQGTQQPDLPGVTIQIGRRFQNKRKMPQQGMIYDLYDCFQSNVAISD